MTTTMQTENGYLYLIFLEKYEDQQLYKIGKSENIIRRFNQHNKEYPNSKLISSAYCSNYNNIENLLISSFRDQFKLVKGREYFKANYEDVKRLFNNITEPYNIEPFTSKLSWPPLKPYKYSDGSYSNNILLQTENDDWEDITRKLRYWPRIMTDFYLEDLWINSEKKEITDWGVYTYDDPKCCLCKENCTKNSSCSDRFECINCSFKFFEEKNRTLDFGDPGVPFCDKCAKEIGSHFYLFIRSYKYGNCILEAGPATRGNG